MKVGHSCTTSRERRAYPYPGKSVKTSSGFGLPGQRTSKKLMLRVRPGVELVRASLVPTSELMTLDLPTFDRPRKAISGSAGGGKRPASVAAAMNRVKTLMKWLALSATAVAVSRLGLNHPDLMSFRARVYSINRPSAAADQHPRPSPAYVCTRSKG